MIRAREAERQRREISEGKNNQRAMDTGHEAKSEMKTVVDGHQK